MKHIGLLQCSNGWQVCMGKEIWIYHDLAEAIANLALLARGGGGNPRSIEITETVIHEGQKKVAFALRGNWE